MKLTKKDELIIVGITVRTSNERGKAEKDIPMLWNTFMEEKWHDKIPSKKNDTIYAVYTDYESDHTGGYTMLLGCEVSDLDNIPEEFAVKIVPKATYATFISKGDLTKDAIINTWMQIWDTELDRSYTCDLEVYGERAANPTNGEADILIAIN